MRKNSKKNKILLIIFIVVLVFSFLNTLKRGTIVTDENGYIDSYIFDIGYKYHESWERIPTESSATLFIKDEDETNELIINIHAFPLKLVGATPENAYETIEGVYKEVYETTRCEDTVIDGVKTTHINYFSDDGDFGGDIYIVVDEDIGYSIMFTEEMQSFEQIQDGEIRDQFLEDMTIN